jgi:Tfp pilus assembly protein PilF
LWYGATIAACITGMASKPIMVTAPVMILLYDRLFLAESFRDLFRRRWGVYVPLTVTWGVLAAVGAVREVFNVGGQDRIGVGFGYAGSTPLEYLLSQPSVILHYLRLAIWPHPLCLDYAWPVAGEPRDFLFPGLTILALLTGVIVALRRRPWLGFLGAWFFVVLSPTSSFIPFPDLAFEHRMYLPLAAVITTCVVAAHALLEWLRRRFPSRDSLLRAVAVLLVATTVTTLGSLTLRRNRDYHSAQVMWDDVVEQRPRNARAHTNLGIILMNQGREDEAIAHYRTALRVNPAYANAHYNLGRALAARGEADEAYRHYEMAVRARPDFSEAHNNLGNLLLRAGRFEEAMAAYRSALESDPWDALLRYNLGLALEGTGRLDEAIVELRHALSIRPAKRNLQLTVGAHHALARIHALQGNRDQAVNEYLEVLKLAPDHPSARQEIEDLRRRSAGSEPGDG